MSLIRRLRRPTKGWTFYGATATMESPETAKFFVSIMQLEVAHISSIILAADCYGMRPEAGINSKKCHASIPCMMM